MPTRDAGPQDHAERSDVAGDQVCLYVSLRRRAGLPDTVGQSTVARVAGMIR
jgi:hypothetical protein